MHQLATKTLGEGYVGYQEDPADTAVFQEMHQASRLHSENMMGRNPCQVGARGRNVLQADAMGETKVIKRKFSKN